MPDYSPWRYGNRDLVRELRARRFRQNARAYEQQYERPERTDFDSAGEAFDQRRDRRSDGGGFLGGLKDVAGDVFGGAADVAKDVGMGALEALDAPRKYVGAPLFAIASGQTEAERVYDPETGEYRREAPDFGDMLSSLQEAFTSNPLDTYREARSASEERLRSLGGAERFLVEAASDPLMAVAVGATGRVASRLPQGAARRVLTNPRSPVGALVEGPGRATPAIFGGGALGAEVAERTDIPLLPEGLEKPALTLAGAGLGARALSRAMRGADTPVQRLVDIKQPQASRYVEALERRGIPWEFAGEQGTQIRIADPELADRVIREGLDELTPDMLPWRSSGKGGLSSGKQWVGDKRVRVRGPGGVPQEHLAGLDPEQHRLLDDLDRISEILKPDEYVDTEALERMRTAWEPNTRLRDFDEVLTPEEKRALEQTWEAGKRTKEGQEAARRLGRAEADQFIASRINPEMSPGATLRELEMEQENMRFIFGQHIDSGDVSTITGKPKASRASTRTRAYIDRLKEAAERLREDGPDIPHTTEPLAPVVRGVDEAARAGGGEPRAAAAEPGVEGVPGVAGGSAEQGDIFGGRQPVAREVAEPGQPGLELEGGSRGQKVPSNQETFLGMEGGELPPREVGRGFPEGRPPEVEEPTGLPPREPPAEPPIRGRGRQQPLGSEEPQDLLNAPAREQVLAAGEKRLTSAMGQAGQKLRSAFGRLKDPEVTTKVDPFLQTKRFLDRRVENLSKWYVMKERMALRASGMEVRSAEDGAYHLYADGRDIGLFEDVVERTSAAGRAGYQSLTAQQREALEVIRETNQAYNQTIRYHGGEPRIDEAIEGDYFGRRVISREYINEVTGEAVTLEKTAGNIPSRRVGAGRTKSRVLESLEEGLEKGIRYDDPWKARERILRGKLLDAEDQYLAENLKPLAKKSTSTLGLEALGDHPAFNNLYFKPEVARRIRAGLDGPQRGTPERFLRSINRVMTPLRATYDISATFQQGIPLWTQHPKQAAEFWWAVTRSLKDETVYENLLRQLDADGPGIEYLLKHDLPLRSASAGGEFIFPEETLARLGRAGKAGKAAAKGVELSNAHFGRYLDAASIFTANQQYKRLTAAGLQGEELDAAMTLAGRAAGRMFGTGTSQPTTIEEASIFAPRYTRASVETLIKAISDGGIEGQMARKHMALMLAEGAAIVWAVNTMRGYETEFDPRDPNFLRFRDLGGLDVSPFGTYNTLFKAIANTAAGEPGKGRGASVWRFAEGKMSPALKMVYEPFIKQETFLGEPTGDPSKPSNWPKLVQEQAKSSVPFAVQNLIEEGSQAAVLGLTGLSATPVSPAERRNFARERLAQELFGQGYEDLPGDQKAQVNEQEDVARYQREVDERALRGEGRFASATEIRTRTEGELDASAEYLERGYDDAGRPFGGNDFRKAYNDTVLRAAGARDLLEDYPGSDETIDGWFDLYNAATMPNGQVNYAKLERLQADYRAKHPAIESEVEKIVGIRDNAAVRELREAKQLAREYYDIPAYRGMNVQQAERAGQILAIANDMVSFGQARDRRDALRQIARVSPQDAMLARRASRMGANPARERFRKTHPLFAKYYADTPATLAGLGAA